MDKIKFGIIGTGHQGKRYADLLRNGKIKNGILGGLCSSNPENVHICNTRYTDIPFFSNSLDMVKSKDIDAVIVCVPHYFHPEIGIEAIKNNVHVLIEKPAGVYTKQVKELNEISLKKPEIAFGIFYNQRMNPLYKRIKEIYEIGEIGEMRRVNWIITNWWRPQLYYDQSKWKGTWAGEGGRYTSKSSSPSIGFITVDTWNAKKVYAKIQYGFKRDINVEDDVTALLEYENGSTGVFVTCTHDILGTDRLEINGDSGKIIVENSKKAIIQRQGKSEKEYNKIITMEEVDRIVDHGEMGKFYEEEILDFRDYTKNYHCELIENFAEHIQRGIPLIAPGIEGINQLMLANAMYLSSWLEQEVSIPIDEDLYLEKLNKRIDMEKDGEIK